MPTPTFDRLAPAKRDAFLDAALAEFAAHDFDTASVSRVVAELGIAKGSVYQYFADNAERILEPRTLSLHLMKHRKSYVHLMPRGVVGVAGADHDRHIRSGAPRGADGLLQRFLSGAANAACQP